MGQEAFSVNIVQESGARARVWPQLLDRHDGSYILRYKMHQSCKDLRIEIKYGDQHVAQSPYKLHGEFLVAPSLRARVEMYTISVLCFESANECVHRTILSAHA